MKIKESTLRQNLVKELRKLGAHPVSIENGVSLGTPDLNWTTGWAELKALEDRPMGSIVSACVLGEKSRVMTQLAWLKLRTNAGGRAFLVIAAGKTKHLLHGNVAHELFSGSVPWRNVLRSCLISTQSYANMARMLLG